MEKKIDLKQPSGKELSQFDNKKPEELESEFDHFDVDNSYPTSPLIVDLPYFAELQYCNDGQNKHLRC